MARGTLLDPFYQRLMFFSDMDVDFNAEAGCTLKNHSSNTMNCASSTLDEASPAASACVLHPSVFANSSCNGSHASSAGGRSR